jgi:hypothetical protein
MHRCRVAPPLKAPSHLNPADCPAKEVVAIVAAVSKYASTLQVAIRPSLFTPYWGASKMRPRQAPYAAGGVT